MIKPYINTLVMLFCSWGLYGYCQHDELLPVISGAAIILSLLLRFKSGERQYAFFERVPLPVLVIISTVGGMFWRSFVPIPPDAAAPLLQFISDLQPASIMGGVLIALRPMTKINLYRLVFCAWLTVALSIDVPFSKNMLLVFAAFSFIALALVIINTMHAPLNKKYTFLYARDYVIFSILLIIMTTLIFLVFSWTMGSMGPSLLSDMDDYFSPPFYTNFLNISPNLSLTTPGTSAHDKRPVMEIRMPKVNHIYLKMQIFDEYHNGTWSEVKDVKKSALPTQLIGDPPYGQIIMFTPLKDLVPAPRGLTAIKASRPYFDSQDQIVYADGPQNSHVLEFSLAHVNNHPVNLSHEEYGRYTSLPESIGPQLRSIAQSITQGQGDEKTKPLKIADYFRKNFDYSLDVDFSANDDGLIRMLEEKRPAYCTYFACALTLLLRAEGIPARVATGFLATEKIDAKHNTFLVRVKNAHAWTEVLVPFLDKNTGQTTYYWRTIDATPPSFNSVMAKQSLTDYIETVFEKIGLSILLFKAEIENIDHAKLKFLVVFFLIVLLTLINLRKIISFIKRREKGGIVSKKIIYKTPDSLRTIYQRYETYLKQNYNEIRRPFDTDTDVLARIKKKSSHQSNALIEEFIKEFHAARFGAKSSEKLENLLKQFTNRPS